MNRNTYKQLLWAGLMICGLTDIPRDASASSVVLDISAYIDGRDLLIVHGDTLQWHHLDYAAVGRWHGTNQPTIISTSLDSIAQINNMLWVPRWPAAPPDEIGTRHILLYCQGYRLCLQAVLIPLP